MWGHARSALEGVTFSDSLAPQTNHKPHWPQIPFVIYVAPIQLKWIGLTLYSRGLAPKTSDASLTGTRSAIRPRLRDQNGLVSLGGKGNNIGPTYWPIVFLFLPPTDGHIRRYNIKSYEVSNYFSVLIEKFTKASERALDPSKG